MAAVSSTPPFVTETAVIFKGYPGQRIVGNVAPSMTGAVVGADFFHAILAALACETFVTNALKVEAVAMQGTVVLAAHLQALLPHVGIVAFAHRVAPFISVTDAMTVAIRGVTQRLGAIFAFPTRVASTLSLNTRAMLARFKTLRILAAVRPAVAFVTITAFFGAVKHQRVGPRVTATMARTLVRANIELTVLASEARVADTGAIQAHTMLRAGLVALNGIASRSTPRLMAFALGITDVHADAFTMH